MCCNDRKKFYNQLAASNKPYRDAPDQKDLRMTVVFSPKQELVDTGQTDKIRTCMLSMHSTVDLANLLEITKTAKMSTQSGGSWKIVFYESSYVMAVNGDIEISLAQRSVTIVIPNAIITSPQGIYPPGRVLTGQFN